MNRPIEVLLAGADSPVRDFIRGTLDSLGCRVSLTDTSSALAALASQTFDVLILDLAPGETASPVLLPKPGPRPEIIIVSQEARLPLEAYEAEVADYIFPPCRPAEMRRRLLRVLTGLQVKSAADRTEARLHDINQRVYDRIAHTAHHLNASLQAISIGMEQLHRQIAGMDDRELDRIFQETYRQVLDVAAKTRDFSNSLAKTKSLNLADRYGRPGLVVSKDRTTPRFPGTKKTLLNSVAS